ncbi:UNVERIFIED_CONTAM: hypothetical protein K2H54_070216 [Gekko kuhli]
MTSIFSKNHTNFEMILKLYTAQNKGLISALYQVLLKEKQTEPMPYQTAWQRDCETQLETWDVALARTARAWANKCIFEHSPYTNSHPDRKYWPIGENIWISNAARRPFRAASAIKAWNDEVRFYDFDTRRCTGVCGHYTQVVWDESYKVGCAIVFCYTFGKSRNIENFVCNYGPG